MSSKKSKSKSKSNTWLERQKKDIYVKKSRQEGYRSRAAYKLIEISKKDHILKKGMIVIDLGSAPGGWSQVAAKIVGNTGKVYAIDLLPMEDIENVEFIQGDFTDEAIYSNLLDKIDKYQKIDLVISDMAPNLSGITVVDQNNAKNLNLLALEFATKVLKIKGSFIIKVFQGSYFKEIFNAINKCFGKVTIRKPDSSRESSKEVYLLATGYNNTVYNNN